MNAVTITTFATINTLIFRQVPTSHRIIDLTAPQKNIEVKIIVIRLHNTFRTKRGQILQYLVADETACCYMNFFNETGKMIKEGDILYVSDAYSSPFKNNLILYQGTNCIVKRLGEHFMKFNLNLNTSQQYVAPSL